jgi:ribosomal protein S18 acetylase RimI-like enzyme
MTDDYRLLLSEGRDETRYDYVRQQLRAYNQTQSEHMRPERKAVAPLDVVMLDQADTILGGLFATTRWGLWLDIDHLWVADALRGQGWGTRLMSEAESAAKKKGCLYARVGTHGFQAKGFYEKCGYRVVGELVDWPPGHTAYMLRKDL